MIDGTYRMKIVILKSSPHKDGASNTLAGFFTKGAEEAGHSICQLDVARMNIAPCLGCDRGKNSGHCIVPDDIGKIEEALTDADMVVYVTPVYFYEMSAQLKLVIDRLHCFYKKLSGKKSLLLATGWRTDDEVMSYLQALYAGLAKYLGLQDMGTIMAKGCGTPALIQESPYAHEAYTLGHSLA